MRSRVRGNRKRMERGLGLRQGFGREIFPYGGLFPPRSADWPVCVRFFPSVIFKPPDASAGKRRGSLILFPFRPDNAGFWGEWSSDRVEKWHGIASMTVQLIRLREEYHKNIRRASTGRSCHFNLALCAPGTGESREGNVLHGLPGAP